MTDSIESVVSGFTEQRFFSAFKERIDEGKPENALNLLLAVLPRLSSSRMNRKEKLKLLLFCSRMLQQAGLGKYGTGKMLRKANSILSSIEGLELPSKKTFVDFGCGAHEPLALSSFFYANGFANCIANDFLPIRNNTFAAISMFEVLSQMMIFPEDFVALGQSQSSFLSRVKNFDLKGFQEGDFSAGVHPIQESVGFLSCNILESGIDHESVSLLVSFAVFEHVFDIKRVCSYLYDISEPGGLQFHFIDLADHRSYRNDGVYNKFSFLTEETGPSNINRLRASEHIANFQAAGFEILSQEANSEAIDEATHNALLPHWKSLDRSDLETHGLTVVLRKPQHRR